LSIRFTCKECSNQLAVPEEHAGKNARCPSCQAINLIPGASAIPPAAPSTPPFAVGDGKAESNPFENPVAPSPNYASPYSGAMSHPAQYQGGYQEPHRGGLILTLGILSLFCNMMMIPGILAWVLGSGDLKKMKAGMMDPSGYGTTQAGMIIGIIATCLVIIVAIFYIAMIVFVIFVGAAGAAGS